MGRSIRRGTSKARNDARCRMSSYKSGDTNANTHSVLSPLLRRCAYLALSRETLVVAMWGSAQSIVESESPSRSNHIKALVLLAVVTAISLVTCTIYRLYLHHLSRFPGPTLAKISTLWCTIGNFRGRKLDPLDLGHVEYAR